MSREEVIAKFAIEMAVANEVDEDGSAMVAIVNRYLDEVGKRGWETGKRAALEVLVDLRSKKPLRTREHDTLNACVHLVDALEFGNEQS